MNSKKKLIIVITGMLVLSGCGRKTLQKADLETVQDLYSYSVGYEVGRNLQQQEARFNLDALYQGIEDVLMETELVIEAAVIGIPDDLLGQKMCSWRINPCSTRPRGSRPWQPSKYSCRSGLQMNGLRRER